MENTQDLQLDMLEFQGFFFEEAEEHLRAIEQGLLQLESAPTDSELLNSIFRSAHTIKGNSGMLGLTDLVDFTHAMETLLDRMRNGVVLASDELITLLLSSADGLAALVHAAKESEPIPDTVAAVLQRLEAVLNDPNMAPPASDDQGESPSEASESTAIELLEETERQVIGELFANPENRAVSAPAAPVALAATAPAAPTSTAPTQTSTPTSAATESIRVSIDKMEDLINLAGELIIANSMVNQRTTRLDSTERLCLEEALAPLNRTTRQLQEQIMALRLVPLGANFRRFNRVVRDMAKTLNKRIRLDIIGEDTELDRQVVEEIGDPLTHLVRNSVDHGIEPPEERIAAGKPAEGAVTLRAYHEGGSVIIEIVDDGRGLNTDRIRAKAIERSLIHPDENPTDEQLHALIFHPGFSTAEKVTDVSGRGVGMDVVRRNIEKLKGSVTVSSTPGEGSVFRIKLPLTMAILDGLSVALGDEMLIIPLLSVVESVRPLPEQVKTAVGSGEVIMVRGRPVPLVRLHRVLNLPAKRTEPTESIVVLVECQQKLVALLVDDLLGQLQVVMKNLETNYEPVDGIAGATILGDGRVAFILDIPGLMHLAEIS